MSTLLLLKLFLVPSLVAAVTLAVRRWGPAMGGWLSGLPLVAGPVLVFYAIEQGPSFAAAAAQATLAGMAANAAYSLAYARICRRVKWYAAVVFSWSVFAAATLVLYARRPGLIASLVLTVAAAILARRLLPRVERVLQPVTTPRGDLAVRLIASAAMVLALTALADNLGPTLSGLLTAFPVLTTTIPVFTQVQRGPAAAVAFFHGFVPAIVGFALFCFVFSVTLERLGLALAVTAAVVVQLAVHGVILTQSLSLFGYKEHAKHRRVDTA